MGTLMIKMIDDGGGGDVDWCESIVMAEAAIMSFSFKYHNILCIFSYLKGR